MIKMIKKWIVECLVSRVEDKKMLQKEMDKLAEENPFKLVLLCFVHVVTAVLLAYIIMALIR